MRTAIALERFHLKQARYPAALQELVPKFAAVVPLDPCAGKEVRYRTTPAGRCMLWCVELIPLHSANAQSSDTFLPLFLYLRGSLRICAVLREVPPAERRRPAAESIPHSEGAQYRSSPRSSARLECVSAPTEMAFTPVAAMSWMVSMVMPPLASSQSLPFTSFTA